MDRVGGDRHDVRVSHTPYENTDAATADAVDRPAEDDTLARPRWRRDTAVFLSGQTVSLFGSMLVQYAVMWHLTIETKSGSVLALSTLFGFLRRPSSPSSAACGRTG